MTVAELIEELQKCPADAQVSVVGFTHHFGMTYDIFSDRLQADQIHKSKKFVHLGEECTQ